MNRIVIVITGACLGAVLGSVPVAAWGPQGHRLVAQIAEGRLSPVARQNIRWLLDGGSLADVASWADEQVDELRQTGPWHYVNIPNQATRYDRDRDCPRQPGVRAGTRADRWRDCIVDRILYNEAQLMDVALDRADRATALKFLVHLVGDIHQPFHGLADERGGNDIPVTLFGSANCGEGSRTAPCNLHGVWDSGLMAHRRLSDQRYLAALEGLVQSRARREIGGTPADWAQESRDIARAALLRPNADAGETYYAAYIGVIDERLAVAGVRLAQLLNSNLPVAPPVR
jgi:nuclease S1